ncbi:MAG: hypothetical protein M4D85_08175 [Actinomycetota bacterium]|nr:hypothetical protein [Actinomycetota bacterium]
MTTTSPLPSRTTTAFFVQAAISFGVASLAVGIGITYLPVDRWIRGFLAVGCLFLVSSAFTLAKCVRDQQEYVLVSRAEQEARMEKFLSEHDSFGLQPAA